MTRSNRSHRKTASSRPAYQTELTLALALLLGVAAVAWAQQRGSDVSSTKHNLTASGPGSVKVGGGGEPCRFCHTPHAASPRAPLWNREDPGTYYEPYTSSTLVADVGQPTGNSRLCLSCHDGTIALDQTLNPRNAGGGTVYLSAQDRGHLGTDLRDDHPISFVYDSMLASRKPGLRDPSTLPASLPLDHQDQLQCTTCHNPHDDRYGKFLRMDNRYSALCASCHHPSGYPTSAHATSNASLHSGGSEWSDLNANTVREAGCQSCHRPHNAGGRERLLRYEAEEMNCLNCHNGSVAQTDIASLTNRFSAHNPALFTGVHDPTEDPNTMNRHVECVDCHNPHTVASGPAVQAPWVKPLMRGVPGWTRSGDVVAEAQYEYQVCYRCHGAQEFAQPTVQRVETPGTVADRFAPTNPSFHPVEVAGRSSDVPSLIAPRTTTDLIHCTDCHGSDQGNGPRGPHGSSASPLLVANYTRTAPQAESPFAYALCYSCHDRNSILNDESFPLHRQHVVDAGMPCSGCHTAHGSTSNSRLIDFDADLAGPAQTTGIGPRFIDQGTRRGSCSLHCHGKEHVEASYE